MSDGFDASRIMLKIRALQNSDARNYLESKERLFLSNLAKKTESSEEKEEKVTEEDVGKLDHLYRKYKKYV